NGSHFLPIRSSICMGKRKPNKKSKSSKYKKVPKSERISVDSQEYLITGNVIHYPQKICKNIHIVTPAEFIKAYTQI
ncbi:MAG: hypothetical protein J7L86_04965, partial [Candidatus Marinimicrobia bacterium]|nr:hypothetical protein [Candidatus Neomarinimicrobiota bacterium]